MKQRNQFEGNQRDGTTEKRKSIHKSKINVNQPDFCSCCVPYFIFLFPETAWHQVQAASMLKCTSLQLPLFLVFLLLQVRWILALRRKLQGYFGSRGIRKLSRQTACDSIEYTSSWGNTKSWPCCCARCLSTAYNCPSSLSLPRGHRARLCSRIHRHLFYGGSSYVKRLASVRFPLGWLQTFKNINVSQCLTSTREKSSCRVGTCHGNHFCSSCDYFFVVNTTFSHSLNHFLCDTNTNRVHSECNRNCAIHSSSHVVKNTGRSRRPGIKDVSSASRMWSLYSRMCVML